MDMAESQGESGQEHHPEQASQLASPRLRPVGLHDWQFLYDLLAERPAHANISHRSMPDIGAHIGFVRSNPYQAWYIIEQQDSQARIWNTGSIYLTHNDEIGIHIHQDHHGQGIAKAAIQELIRQHPKPSYKANIAPLNNISQKMFMELGFNLIQYTYELRPS